MVKYRICQPVLSIFYFHLPSKSTKCLTQPKEIPILQKNILNSAMRYQVNTVMI